MQVRDVMVYGAVTIDAGASVAEAAQLMAHEDVGMLVIGTDQKVLGVITDRDLLVKCVGSGDMPDSRSVGEFMSAPAVTIGTTADVIDVARVLREKSIQRLPVVDGGKLVGVVSYTDIAQSLGQVMHDLMFGAGEVRRNPGAVQVGWVTHFYNHLGVAVLNLQMPIHNGDMLHVAGHSTNFEQMAKSMQIDHREVTAAFPGDDLALKVNGIVRSGDRVYKVPPED